MQSPIEIVRAFDRRQEWDEREREVMRLWYTTARWEDLLTLLPNRTKAAITIAALRMHVGDRPFLPKDWCPIPHDEMLRLASIKANALNTDRDMPIEPSSSLDTNILLDIATRLSSSL